MWSPEACVGEEREDETECGEEGEDRGRVRRELMASLSWKDAWAIESTIPIMGGICTWKVTVGSLAVGMCYVRYFFCYIT